MDATIWVSLVCQPCKTKPPAQVQLYCGFLYNSVGIPCLQIPANKIDQALATISFLWSGAASEWFLRLTLAVVVGLLQRQSLVEATPNNSGQTYLCWLYDCLHCLDGLPPNLTPKSFYYTQVELGSEEWLDLNRWKAVLGPGLCHYARSRNQGDLGITWGDGSGTGTSGTFQFIPAGQGNMSLEVLMGIWEPQVFHFSSNWKDLHTLLHTLE
jgi:hypothetical protein